MTGLPSLVPSTSSSSSEDTSSASAEVDNIIRASLNLPGLSNNARLVNSQPGSARPSIRNSLQSRQRLVTSNQLQTRHANRENHYAPHGHRGDSYFEHSDHNHASKSSATSECNLSICYSYLLAAISSIMVVVGIYFALTRLNLNYLYLSLAGLLLEALGACLYCLGNVQMNRKARRKLGQSDLSEAIDSRSLAAAAAATHILNTRGLIHISNNHINPALRNANNTNFTSSGCETNNNDSLLVTINSNGESGLNSPNPPESAPKYVKKVPLKIIDQQITAQQVGQESHRQNSDRLIDAEEGLSSDGDEVAMSQLSLNMIPQYFSNGVSLRPDRSSQPSGPASSTFINLTTGAFSKANAPGTSSVNNETSVLKKDQVSFELGEQEPVASSSSTPSSHSATVDQSRHPRDGGAPPIEISDNVASVGPLSQSQIVIVRGRHFLILPLNDKKNNLNEQQQTSSDFSAIQQEPVRDNVPSSSSASNYDGQEFIFHQQSPYTQQTTEEIIDKIRTLGELQASDQAFKGIHASSSGPSQLRRESSFTFNNKRVNDGASTSNEASSTRTLRQSHSFNERFNMSRKMTTDKKACLNGKNIAILSCENRTKPSCHQQQPGERPPDSSQPLPLPPTNSNIEIQPCSSGMLETSCPGNGTRASTSCVEKTARSSDETGDLSQNHTKSDRGSIRNTVASSSKQKLPLTGEAQPHCQNDSQPSNNLLHDMKPSTSSLSGDQANLNKENGNNQTKKSNSSSRASSSNSHHRATLIMSLSGEEELIEINEADIDNMSMLPPSYESLMG